MGSKKGSIWTFLKVKWINGKNDFQTVWSKKGLGGVGSRKKTCKGVAGPEPAYLPQPHLRRILGQVLLSKKQHVAS